MSVSLSREEPCIHTWQFSLDEDIYVCAWCEARFPWSAYAAMGGSFGAFVHLDSELVSCLWTIHQTRRWLDVMHGERD